MLSKRARREAALAQRPWGGGGGREGSGGCKREVLFFVQTSLGATRVHPRCCRPVLNTVLLRGATVGEGGRDEHLSFVKGCGASSSGGGVRGGVGGVGGEGWKVFMLNRPAAPDVAEAPRLAEQVGGVVSFSFPVFVCFAEGEFVVSFSFSAFLVLQRVCSWRRRRHVWQSRCVALSFSFPVFVCFAEGVCPEADALQEEGPRPVVGWGWGGGGVGGVGGGGGVESVHVEQAGCAGRGGGATFGRAGGWRSVVVFPCFCLFCRGRTRSVVFFLGFFGFAEGVFLEAEAPRLAEQVRGVVVFFPCFCLFCRGSVPGGGRAAGGKVRGRWWGGGGVGAVLGGVGGGGWKAFMLNRLVFVATEQVVFFAFLVF